MIEYPEVTTDSTNDYFTWGNAMPRNVVISNAGGAQALFRLTKDATLVAAANCDLVVPAGETVVLRNVSVQVISGVAGQTVGVWRY